MSSSGFDPASFAAWIILHRHLRGLDDAAFGRIVDAAERIRPLTAVA